MGIKEQFGKIKDNWLILLLALVVLILLTSGLNLGGAVSSRLGSMANYALDSTGSGGGYAAKESYTSGYSPSYAPSASFAPGVTERKITKTSYLTSEIKRGKFQEARASLNNIITTSGAYLLDENTNRYGDEKHPYFVGSYQLKVDATKYDAVVSQLKELGVVKSFTESQTDITGSYTNLQIELDAEKARLVRYQTMLKEATLTADKITLGDRIFDQERTIKYYEESLANMDQRVDYSTIYLTLNEKQSDYANLVLVKLSDLVYSLVESFNTLLHLLFVLVPWALAVGIIAIVVKLFRSKKPKSRKA
jgi:hypothetical protein